MEEGQDERRLITKGVEDLGVGHTEVSLDIPGNLPYEEWTELGRKLGRLSGSLMWWVGDWLNYGEHTFPTRDTLDQAAEATGIQPQTLLNVAWTCRRIPPAERRPDVFFGHHQVVAALAPLERQQWLETSAANKWTNQKLRLELGRARSAIELPEGAVYEPDSAPDQEEGPPGRDHVRIQALLLKLGRDLGFDIWVARDDKTRRYGSSDLSTLFPLLKTLPLIAPGNPGAQKIVERIDVLWLKGGTFYAAFEIEATTPVYSGLLRMSDLLTLVPQLQIPLYVLAPFDKQPKVCRELIRPTFERLRLAEKCRVITFEKLTGEVDQVGDRFSMMDPSAYLEFLSETCEQTPL